ncbi:hypothetical protein [Polaribacter sp. Hel_I_88]|uniref:hypothetical protein n=1 Tax=Polaribacter sp. Hel_I_88 TaxID=1250006 RepID=UPI00047C872D|nr:hypothetical protein [Polaribacter sp. Hel_I_88]
MKAKLLLLAFTISCYQVFTQDLIAVQNGGDPIFYEDLSEAIKKSVTGDTLFVPAKNYVVNDTIRKELHIIGEGYDLTNNLGATILSSKNNTTPMLVLEEGASNGSITGIRFSVNKSGVYSRNIFSVTELNNYLIDRCFLSLHLYASNSLVKNCILSNTTIQAKITSVLSNNILVGNGYALSKCSIRNNIFLVMSDRYNSLNPNECNIDNNIFPPNYRIWYPVNCSLRNNLNISLNGVSGDNFGSSNFDSDLVLNETFINYTQLNGIDNNSANFQLIANSSFKNAGTDGTDLGIYGGRFPWKDGSAPFNPQIIFSEIPGTTDENGVLKIRIEVEAQKN